MTTREPTLFDAELSAVLPALAGFVPVKMSLDQLGHFRSLSSPNRDDLIGDMPVVCVDHLIPGYQGATIVVSVISRKDHQRPGPGICFLHGGGMVMGNRFAGAAPVVQWAIKHDAVCVAVEYRLAPEHPSPVPVEDCNEAPARATDLRGLPPTFIDVGGAETFRDEDIAYAAGILSAGGECELHVWGGAFHGFYDIAPQSALSRACIAAREDWLARLLAR